MPNPAKADAEPKATAKPAKAKDAGPALVEVRKGDETLFVHPATVAAHVRVGWTIAEATKGA